MKLPWPAVAGDLVQYLQGRQPDTMFAALGVMQMQHVCPSRQRGEPAMIQAITGFRQMIRAIRYITST